MSPPALVSRSGRIIAVGEYGALKGLVSAILGFLLLGGPKETRESVEESLAFADSLGLEMLKVTVGIRIYPRTPLAKSPWRKA